MDISKHPQLYKKKSLSQVKNRTTSQLSNTEKQKVETVIGKFFELFMNKHL
jgi:hypothetical protein